MPDSLTSETQSGFLCACEKRMRSACAGEPLYKEHEGKRYCVLHFPSKEKGADFEKAFQRKLDNKDFNFRGVWFPGKESFEKFDFTGAVNFSSATFSAEAYFYSVTFSAAADFRSATFSAAAYFRSAKFSAAADFSSATFSAEAYFYSVTFSAAADFRSATFSAAAYFRHTTFRDYVEFSGSKTKQVFSPTSSLDLQFGKIEKPARVSFHTLTLHPHWFVNIDPRQFDFINVDWSNCERAKAEIKQLKNKWVESPNRLLAIACQKLAANCEEKSQYRSASHFRRMALDAERLETWRGFDFRRLNWWYWLASGYGERPFQALLVLIGILVLFGLLYTQVGFARWEAQLASEVDAVVAKRDDVGASLKLSRALTYSAGAMTLQRPEPKPATTTAQTVVLLETVLGPVQAALLALAIRRKFMR